MSTLTSNVTAMPICRKCIKIDTGSISYVQLNYSRVIRIINAREIIFRYELVHIPSSRLKDDGSMGRVTFKYRLKKKKKYKSNNQSIRLRIGSLASLY